MARPSLAVRRARRSAARLHAVQALFQMEAAGTPLDQVREEFETHRLGLDIDGESYGDADLDHFRRVIHEAVNNQARIDQLTDRALVARWPIARIDPTLRALFRAAGAELVGMDTPPKAVIAEYVAVTRAFFPEGREQKFVNAVLDHVARQVRPEAFAGD